MTHPTLRTDYARIAPDYDADRAEYDSFDGELARLLAVSLGDVALAGCPRTLVDVGCGTGTVLSRFEDESDDAWEWSAFGFDANPRMLDLARGKVYRSRLGGSLASALPLKAGSAGCLISPFAFHHCGGLGPFLAEGFRVLAPGGRLILRNILPRDGPEPLMYRFFPETQAVDVRRFPLRSELLDALVEAGFVLLTELRMHNAHRFTPARYAELCRKRTLSQLDLILDEHFRRGMAAIDAWGADHPGEELEEAVPVYTLVAERLEA